MNSEFKISNDLDNVDQALVLHDLVFQEGRQTRYNSREEWLKRINSGGYFAVVIHESKAIGYVVCDVTEKGDFRVWLAGVRPEFRKQGVWSALYENVKQQAKDMGYEYMLLNTFPSKFPAMYSFLQSVNAEIYKKEMVEGEEKYFAKIAV